MLLKGLIILFLFLILPEFLGLLVTHFSNNEKNDILFALVIGYLVECGILQLISIPIICMHLSLSLLVRLYVLFISILFVISFLINIKSIKDIFNNIITSFTDLPK